MVLAIRSPYDCFSAFSELKVFASLLVLKEMSTRSIGFVTYWVTVYGIVQLGIKRARRPYRPRDAPLAARSASRRARWRSRGGGGATCGSGDTFLNSGRYAAQLSSTSSARALCVSI